MEQPSPHRGPPRRQRPPTSVASCYVIRPTATPEPLLTCISPDEDMTTSIPAGPDPAAVVRYILDTYRDADLVEAMNAYFFSVDPEKHWPNFATLVTTNEHDDASDLDRPGVFRQCFSEIGRAHV